MYKKYKYISIKITIFAIHIVLQQLYQFVSMDHDMKNSVDGINK